MRANWILPAGRAIESCAPKSRGTPARPMCKPHRRKRRNGRRSIKLCGRITSGAESLPHSVLGRVQTAGARADRDVGARGVVVERLLAVPEAGAAEGAFVAVEQRHAIRPRRERLTRAHLDAQLGGAALTEIGIQERDMVGVSGGRL